MAMWIAEDYEPLPPGLYVGKLLDIESRESANGEYRRWSWEVLEGPDAGRNVYANTSTNFGPQAKARQWVENILDRELEAGEQVGIEDESGLNAGRYLVQRGSGRGHSRRPDDTTL
jgi:hypothetical protein